MYMRYEINCECGIVLSGEATHDNFGVLCDCGKKHLVRASGDVSSVPPRRSELQNPFSPPMQSAVPKSGEPYSLDKIRNEIAAPAIGLIGLSAITVALLVLALVFEMFLIASGAADEMPREAVTKQSTEMVRSVWSFIMLIANVVILFGAVSMKNLKNYGFAKSAAGIACVPCIGPCFILGIPFGIMAFVVLSRFGVRDAFEE